jgi:hexosaminidase
MRPFVLAWGCVVVLCAALSHESGAQSTELAIIPRPVSLTRGSGNFTLSGRTVISTDRGDSAVAARFARSIASATGFALPVRIGSATSGNRIVFQRAARDTTLGDEGYRLDVKPSVVTITANAPAGAFYATQTIRQLLSPDIYRAAPVAPQRTWTMPAVRIVDRPRFGYRGMHLDVARHFMPKEFVKKYIDLLALHKMNRFHWHLTDDQGWRLEIKKYPRLTEIGAWRDSTIVGRMTRDTLHAPFDKKRHGGFYTQDDVREIVAYAAERFVTIVPEIEMPGHSQAAVAAYPYLGNFGDTIKPWTMWGVTNYILNPSDTTIAFMQDVVTEVMQLFPGPFIHVGGDEAPKIQWRNSPRAQRMIDALHLRDAGDSPRAFKSEDRLQSWFITKMDAFLTAHGRRLIGWDEILEGGLAPNAVVMSWRGLQGGITAARAQHDVVMTPGGYTYFDHYQASADSEPLAIGGFLPIDSVYLYEPVPAELEPEYAKHILGAQAQVWTEYIEGPKQVEYMAYPRAAALAEVLWTPAVERNLADFKRRLVEHEGRLTALDVNYRR